MNMVDPHYIYLDHWKQQLQLLNGGAIVNTESDAV